jgi:hypothetical protein
MNAHFYNSFYTKEEKRSRITPMNAHFHNSFYAEEEGSLRMMRMIQTNEHIILMFAAAFKNNRGLRQEKRSSLVRPLSPLWFNS